MSDSGSRDTFLIISHFCCCLYCYIFSSYVLVINLDRISQIAVRNSLEQQLDPTGPVALGPVVVRGGL